MFLEAKNITKSYKLPDGKQISVLKDINLQIDEGDNLALIGASGSGKSTLLNLLATIDKPDSGSIHYYLPEEVDVLNLSEQRLSKIRNTSVGFIFQFHNLLPEFTALENVLIPKLIQTNRSQDPKDIQKAKDLLDHVGMSHRLDHKPNELSGGEQQRVSIARSLINDPQIIFADEPTGNLDESNTETILDLIKSIQNEYKLTFITATHSKQVAEYAVRNYELKGGSLT